MTSTNFLDKFLSFLDCSKSSEYQNDNPNSINHEQLNNNNLSFNKGEMNHSITSDLINKDIDLDKSFCGDIIEQKVDDLYIVQNNKNESLKIEENKIKNDFKETEK